MLTVENLGKKKKNRKLSIKSAIPPPRDNQGAHSHLGCPLLTPCACRGTSPLSEGGWAASVK